MGLKPKPRIALVTRMALFMLMNPGSKPRFYCYPFGLSQMLSDPYTHQIT